MCFFEVVVNELATDDFAENLQRLFPFPFNCVEESKQIDFLQSLSVEDNTTDGICSVKCSLSAVEEHLTSLHLILHLHNLLVA